MIFDDHRLGTSMPLGSHPPHQLAASHRGAGPKALHSATPRLLEARWCGSRLQTAMCQVDPFAWCASADSLRRYFGWTFKGPRALRPLTGGDSKPGALVMCDIPLDLERRFERRWAARFSGPAKEHRLEPQQQHQLVTTPDKSNRKTRRVEPAGLKPLPTV